MKTKFLVLTLLVTFGVGAMAQDKKGKFTPEQRVEKKVEKMQKGLMLDDAKAEKFASIYKEYLLEMQKCRPEVVRGKELSDEQLKKNMESCMEAREKAVKVEKKYYGKLEKILNAKQLYKVFGKQDKAPMGGKKPFVQRGKRDGKGFAKAPGQKGQWKGAPGRGACKPGDMKKCDKNGASKADCKKDCKKDCDKECEKDCKKDCKSNECTKAGEK